MNKNVPGARTASATGMNILVGYLPALSLGPKRQKHPHVLLFVFNIYLFIWLGQVSFAALRIFVALCRIFRG